MENIQKLLQQHEALKSKGLRLNEDDVREWLDLQRSMEKYLTENQSIYDEEEGQLKLDRGIKGAEIMDQYSNATKLNLALDVIFFDRIKKQIILKSLIEHYERQYILLGKYHDSGKKIYYK